MAKSQKIETRDSRFRTSLIFLWVAFGMQLLVAGGTVYLAFEAHQQTVSLKKEQAELAGKSARARESIQTEKDIAKLREKALLSFDGRERAWTTVDGIRQTMGSGLRSFILVPLGTVFFLGAALIGLSRMAKKSDPP